MDPDAMEQQKPEQLKDRSTTLGDGHFLWFKAMQENGIKPMDAILAATKNIAAAYHKLDELGTIEKGKLADLVVLDADPLDDLNNIRKISMVMKDGQVVDRGSLPLKKALTAPRDTHVVVVTDAGEIEIEVDTRRAPRTAANFLKYVDGHFYDGGAFYQHGDAGQSADRQDRRSKSSRAASAPGREKEQFPPIALERTKETGIWHVDGAVSMARDVSRTRLAPTFFICIGEQPELDFGGARNPDGQGFAAFGRVVRGMDIVRKIQKSSKKEQQLTPAIRIVRVTRKPLSPAVSP